MLKSKKLFKVLLTVAVSTSLLTVTAFADTTTQAVRIAGKNRYDTAIKIATDYQGGKKADNIVLASGNNYADALSGGLLCKELNAPMLLMSGSSTYDTATLNYCYANINAGGTFFILGGNGAVSSDLDAVLEAQGYKVVRLAGKDRYETSYLINMYLNDHFDVVKNADDVIVANGTNFQTCLGASEMSVIEEEPFQLVRGKECSEYALNISRITTNHGQLLNGDHGGVHEVGSDVAGADTFSSHTAYYGEYKVDGNSDYCDARMANACYFDLSFMSSQRTYGLECAETGRIAENVIVCTGKDYPDALTGSTLVSKYKAFINFVADNTDLSVVHNVDVMADMTKDYGKGIDKKLIIIGGTGAVSTSVENNAKSELGIKSATIVK